MPLKSPLIVQDLSRVFTLQVWLISPTSTTAFFCSGRSGGVQDQSPGCGGSDPMWSWLPCPAMVHWWRCMTSDVWSTCLGLMSCFLQGDVRVSGLISGVHVQASGEFFSMVIGVESGTKKRPIHTLQLGVSINGDTQNWMVYEAKSHLQMDDDWGYPHWWNPDESKFDWFSLQQLGWSSQMTADVFFLWEAIKTLWERTIFWMFSSNFGIMMIFVSFKIYALHFGIWNIPQYFLRGKPLHSLQACCSF